MILSMGFKRRGILLMNLEISDNDLIEIIQGLQNTLKLVKNSLQSHDPFCSQTFYLQRIEYLEKLILKLDGGI